MHICIMMQVTSDMPPHASLRGADASDAGNGPRTFDDGCRGVGGSMLIPTTSAGAICMSSTATTFCWWPMYQAHDRCLSLVCACMQVKRIAPW